VLNTQSKKKKNGKCDRKEKAGSGLENKAMMIHLNGIVLLIHIESGHCAKEKLMIKIHGVRLSPFVRKVHIVLAAKGIPFEANEITPFELTDEYRQNFHPLGKIPCLEEDDFILPDSSAICNYLEGIQPEPRLIPTEPKARARTAWFEEYADSEGARVFGGMFFFERWVKPLLLKQETNEELVQTALEKDIPRIFNYLNRNLENSPFLVGDSLTLADISLFTQVHNANLAGFLVDRGSWPVIVDYFKRISDQEPVAKVLSEEVDFLKEMERQAKEREAG
jgi:glutathione S-transferase